MIVPKVTTAVIPQSLAELTAMLDSVSAQPEAVDCVNWREYPYQPQVSVRMAHTGNALLLHWRVSEQWVRAVIATDNGQVWDDSCVEFFLRLDQCSPYYYNVECNCAGRLLVGRGTGNHDRVHADATVMSSVLRFKSISDDIFDTRQAPAEWQLGLYIPLTALFADRLSSLDGLIMTGNFYKIGDRLPQPHYLSWNPIDLPTPLFHCPDYFGLFRFGR